MAVVELVIFSTSATTATAASESAKSGDLTAALNYSGTYPQARSPRLRITQSGKILYDRPVSSAWCGSQCWPDLYTAGKAALHIVHLQSDGPSTVVLDLYNGGAHCCSVEQVFSLDAASKSFQKSEYNFGDPGAQLVRLGPGASTDFVSADDSFAYQFTDFAASGMPSEILSFSHRAFHNVTRSFPNLITQDAKQLLRAFDSSAGSRYQDTVGIVAAWAADQDMLGHYSAVQSFLTKEVKEGHLNSALSPIEPSGQKFVIALQTFLRKHGYVK
jgi:hypothetical protein